MFNNVNISHSYVIWWLTLTLHINQNAKNRSPFQVYVLSFTARRVDFGLCLPLKLSDYICSDGTNKWFFIIMHYGIIFSCMENFKDQQWPVFFSDYSWRSPEKEQWRRTGLIAMTWLQFAADADFTEFSYFGTGGRHILKHLMAWKTSSRASRLVWLLAAKKYNVFYSAINWLFWVLKIEDKVLCRDY